MIPSAEWTSDSTMPSKDPDDGGKPVPSVRGRASQPLQVLQAALLVEPDLAMAGDWYRHTSIAELDNFTAAQLVSAGRAAEVLAFLHALSAGERG